MIKGLELLIYHADLIIHNNILGSISFVFLFFRLNLTNAEEALFSLENLDTLTSMMMQENNSLRIRIYSYNQKGRSAAYLLPDFIIGSTAYKTGEWHTPKHTHTHTHHTHTHTCVCAGWLGLIDGWEL